jgi:hypothetical protein
MTQQQLIILFFAAFLLRAFVFYNYISVGERYKQADSTDYHSAALTIKYGFGMSRPDTGEPQFWRTPGYPLYLVPFYKIFKQTGFQFSDAQTAQKASIWFQIVLSSFIPIILFYLALYLTSSFLIAFITAWISVFHLGLVLTSGYLLTEGIALAPFYLFLYYFYRSFRPLFQQNGKTLWWPQQIVLAAIMLAIYTWIRPMGNYIAFVAMLILLLFAQDNFKRKAKKATLFLIIFYTLLSPWYIRNYRLTGQWFFCPMFGAYLNSFCAPRIVSAVNNVDLLESWKQLGFAAHSRHQELNQESKLMGLHTPKEFACGQIAWPIFLNYPWLAFSDWIREVFKTTFDLYSSQLSAFVNGCFFYDPLIEYLSEKLAECLYKTPMPPLMRLIVYLELLYACFLWIGLIAGLCFFVIMPLLRHFEVHQSRRTIFGLWMVLLPMIAATVFMTGGFGYARLRLPIEPLMIILSLTWWYMIYMKYKKGLS